MEVNGSGLRAPQTKAARHALIGDVVGSSAVRSQSELASALAERGVEVTQATLSRDLVELGAVKVRAAGGLVYALPSEGGDRTPRAAIETEVLHARLGRLCEELLVTAEASANLVVLRTPPGAAQFLASAIDHSVLPEVLGSIAGDDTVLVIARAADGGTSIAARFLELAHPVRAGAAPLTAEPLLGPSDRDISPDPVSRAARRKVSS